MAWGKGGTAWIATSLVIGACAGPPAGMEDFPLASGVLAILRDARPFQLRLGDDQRHLPCAPADTTTLIPGASCATPAPGVLRELAELAPRIGDAVRVRPTADALWAAALLDIASGTPDERQLDRAIRRLTEVVARDSTRAAPRSHRAVAHVARASLRGDARDLFAALDDIEQAWERDSASRAIRFNRTAIHALMQTSRHARIGWDAYQRVERDAGWRREAGERLAALPPPRPSGGFTLSAAGVRGDPQAAREFVLDSLLPSWARATLRADSAAAREAAADVRMVARELLAFRGDSSVLHLSVAIGSPPSDGVARGIVRLVEGTRLYRGTGYVAARDVLAGAVRDLRAAGGAAASLADWASLMLGATFMAERQHDLATRTLASVASGAAERGDRALEARALWAGAIAVGRRGSLDESDGMFRRAHDLFATIGEHRNAATMLAGMSDAESLMGRSMEAANLAFRAYVATARAGGVVRYEDLLIGAQQMTDQGRHRASAHLLNEAALAAAEGRRAKDLPESLGRLALAQVAMGRRDLAAATIARARDGATRVDDAAMRSRLDAELQRSEAQVVAASNPRSALALVDSSRRYFATISGDHAALLLTRARLALQLGDSTAAARDLADATRTVRTLAPGAAGEQARQLAATLRDAHRTLIELALARGDTALAFEETVALPAIGPREQRPRAARLPPVPAGRAEVRFVVTPGRVLTWVRSGDGRSLATAAIAREALGARVARFINVVRSGDDTTEVRTLGQALYGALLGAHDARLAGVTALDVYTDGVLADLPLAVLTDDRGRYLVERFATRYVVAAGSRDQAGGKPTGRGPLLVGNPAWRREDFPGLEPLRRADEEVERISGLWAQRTVLSGAEASKAALLTALPRHEVIHFAGHSRVVVENPGLSHLVLAAGRTFGDGVLYASEIAKLDLRGVKLVVLSSCGRTREDASSMGELNGLATAFLDAGVEAVVAGLWEVEDEGIAALATSLHGMLVRGATPEEALMAAQRATVSASRERPGASTGAAAFTVQVLH